MPNVEGAPELVSAAERLATGRAEVDARLSSLRDDLKRLLGNGLVPDAASKQFEVLYDAFDRGATQAMDGLAELSGFLHTQAATADGARASDHRPV